MTVKLLWRVFKRAKVARLCVLDWACCASVCRCLAAGVNWASQVQLHKHIHTLAHTHTHTHVSCPPTKFLMALFSLFFSLLFLHKFFPFKFDVGFGLLFNFRRPTFVKPGSRLLLLFLKQQWSISGYQMSVCECFQVCVHNRVWVGEHSVDYYSLVCVNLF